MNIICKLFGHNLTRESILEDKYPISDKGWLFHKSFHLIFTCRRCGKLHTNSVNFGEKIIEIKEKENESV
jgi:hypothetical protein